MRVRFLTVHLRRQLRGRLPTTRLFQSVLCAFCFCSSTHHIYNIYYMAGAFEALLEREPTYALHIDECIMRTHRARVCESITWCTGNKNQDYFAFVSYIQNHDSRVCVVVVVVVLNTDYYYYSYLTPKSCMSVCSVCVRMRTHSTHR
jgi:hypothetical protein